MCETRQFIILMMVALDIFLMFVVLTLTVDIKQTQISQAKGGQHVRASERRKYSE